MSTGFKTGLFGYNKEEVHRFLQQQSALYKEQAAQKEELLKKQQQELETLRAAVQELEQTQQALQEKLTFLNGRLEHYRGREEEIEKMSVGIGTMYVAARQSATEIILKAENCAHTVAEQSKRQLAAVQQTAETLSKMQQQVQQTTDLFAQNLQPIYNELQETVANIDEGLQALNETVSAPLGLETGE